MTVLQVYTLTKLSKTYNNRQKLRRLPTNTPNDRKTNSESRLPLKWRHSLTPCVDNNK